MSTIKNIFAKQFLHVVSLLLLIIGLFIAGFLPGFTKGQLWGIDTVTWLYCLVIITVFHQTYVWFCWRTELHLGLLRKWFGRSAFTLYATLFFVFIIFRPICITLLAISNKNSIAIHSPLNVIAAALLAAPALYLIYSVERYFGFKRASGIDHFDSAYAKKGFVKKGIFRFTNNGMYTFGFFILWIPGVFFSSLTAIIAALFSHAYIWVHYFCTEKPDMDFIYGRKGE